jgi:hypothetical protein
MTEGEEPDGAAFIGVRIQPDAEERTPGLRRFGPTQPDHWSVGQLCPACHRPIEAGDFTTLVALGPGANPEQRERARAGRFYNAVGVVVHHGCATGVE